MTNLIKCVCKNPKCSEYWKIKEIAMVGEINKVNCPICGKKMRRVVYQYRDYGNEK